MGEGKKIWLFPDGDLPPAGGPDSSIEGHEALMVLNTGAEDAHIELTVYFPDREPVTGIELSVLAERIVCFRLDKPLGSTRYQIPFGQYALRLESSVPIVAQMGRADVRQANLAYYTTLAYPAD